MQSNKTAMTRCCEPDYYRRKSSAGSSVAEAEHAPSSATDFHFLLAAAAVGMQHQCYGSQSLASSSSFSFPTMLAAKEWIPPPPPQLQHGGYCHGLCSFELSLALLCLFFLMLRALLRIASSCSTS
jgi:hypothetical protein